MTDERLNSNGSNLDNTALVCVAQICRADILGFTWMPPDSGHRSDETRIFIRVCGSPGQNHLNLRWSQSSEMLEADQWWRPGKHQKLLRCHIVFLWCWRSLDEGLWCCWKHRNTHTHHSHNITALELVKTSSTVQSSPPCSNSPFRNFREWTWIWIVKKYFRNIAAHIWGEPSRSFDTEGHLLHYKLLSASILIT